MVQAPVGWQCPDCTKEGSKRSRQVPAFTRTGPGRSGVVGSTNPTPIVLTIVAVNVVVFFLERFGTDVSVIARYGLWPHAVHAQSQYYRAFTAMWLHANFLHIAANMVFLLVVGSGVGGAVGQGALRRPLPHRRTGRQRRVVPAQLAQRGGDRGVGGHHGRVGRLCGASGSAGASPSPPWSP